MPRDNAERKPPSQEALTSEEVRARIAGVLRSETEISAADIAERIGVSLARVNGHLTALDQANLAVRCNGVGADGQRVTLWRAKNLRGPSKKYRTIRARILKALAQWQCATGELFERCGGLRSGDRVRFHATLCDMHRRGLVGRHKGRNIQGGAPPDIWSLPPPPAHLGDDGDVQSQSEQSKKRKAIP